MRIRKWMIIWTAVTFLTGCFPVCLHAEEPEDDREPANLYARSAVLMDADSGRVLFGREEDVSRPMASTTKIMTCILALEHTEEDAVAVVSDYAASQPKVHLGVQKNEQYRVRDLLYSLMLESHNDSAVVIAETVAGSVKGFAKLMNDKAEELGCANTHFVTPNGLDGADEGGAHATTARELAAIMKYCIQDSPRREEFLQITGTRTYAFCDISGKRNFSCNNHNAFLGMMEGALSGKTGFTGDAGYCYVGALESEGRTFIVALLACGWPNNKGYKWADTRKLMTYGIRHFRYKEISSEIKDRYITVENGIPDEKALSGKAKAEVSMEKQKFKILLKDTEQIEEHLQIKETCKAPVRKGQIVGSITYTLNGRKIREFEIKASEAVGERTYDWCLSRIFERFSFQFV